MNDLSTRCRHCGHNKDMTIPGYEQKTQTSAYLVVILCSSCGSPYVSLSRN